MIAAGEGVPAALARWRSTARGCLAADFAPEQVAWEEDGRGHLLFGASVPPAGEREARHRVPRGFLLLAGSVACHRAAERWPLLYRLLWRLTHGEPFLLSVASDPLVHRLLLLHRSVRRATHKMKAFVRFRAISGSGADDPEFVAWFEPAQRVVERTAPFFVERFGAMRWSILTPDGCARWDRERLLLTEGIASRLVPATEDALEDLWRTYYAGTFNPARLNRAAMRTEMPARYWKNLPEARLIAGLAREAPARVAGMIAQSLVPPAPLPSDLEAAEASPAPRPAAEPPGWHPVHDPGWREARRRADAVQADRGVIRRFGAELLTGVAGWTDPSILAPGVFYPPDASTAESRLRHYAGRFPLVEVDATYYALPSAETSRRWVERTPAHFAFDVKAHALMTGHPTEPARLPPWLRDLLPVRLRAAAHVYSRHFPEEALDEVWRRFLSALAPLRAAGKLGAVMLQFPRWFTPNRESADYLARCRERLGDWPASVELRHRDWLSGRLAARTFALLGELRFSYVAVDAPAGMESSLPPLMRVTDPELALVRLHGRRQSTWEARNEVVTERYRYLYDEDELTAWLSIIESAAREARRVHILFNNNHANYATTNAAELQQLLLAAA